MTFHCTPSARHIFLTSCLALASAAVGCGSSSEDGPPQVDSGLLGIYTVDLFQTSDDCEELMDEDGAPRLVLYSTPRNDDPDEAVMVGQLCGTLEDCRLRADGAPAVVNYSFFEGSDEQGWIGYGIARTGFSGDQCAADVQVHVLASTSGQSIEIDTREVETVYPPENPGRDATCTIEDALAAVMEDSPCTGLFRLEATFETEL